MICAQIVTEKPSKIPTGAEIRNSAIEASLSAISETYSIAVESYCQPYQKGKRVARTVSCLADETISAILHELSEISPHVIVLEGVGLFSLAQPVRDAFPAAKLIMDFHNIEHCLLRDLDISRFPKPLQFLAPAVYGRSWTKALAVDMAAGQLADEVWVCSDGDAEIARKIGVSGRVQVIPNPVPNWCKRLPLPDSSSDFKMLFVGHLRYPPNKHAVRFLLEKLVPKVRLASPALQAVIAGRNPGKRVRKHVEQTAGVSLIADPDDLSPIYEQCSVLVLPIFEGGGTRIKVLEALAVGRPIVATMKAVEGLGLTPNVHYLRAETVDEFSQSILALLCEKDLGEELRHNGFTLIEQQYSDVSRQKRMESILHSLIG